MLADKLGRTKQFICRKAKELGLTSKKNEYELSEESHRKLSEILQGADYQAGD